MQGLHKEGECRQLEFWTWKSYVRLPILHNSKWAETSRRILMEYLKNIGANNYQRGPTRWAQPTWARQGAQTRPGGLCSAWPTSGAHLLVYKSFWPKKNKERTFGMERRRLEVGLGKEHFCPLAERFRRGNFPPGGGNHRHHHHQPLSHLGRTDLYQHLHEYHLISKPQFISCIQSLSQTSDWYLWVTSSVD